ncbi:GGDEF domain-containing protein [Actinospica robiniae]|uniref:GGDEF domain-containing protein n=1 Tax=Actinospica robiniae TaxID=304901 RepID=UPI000410B217|nr:GGDEF domain-containing protein [Actinospica robiniae]
MGATDWLSSGGWAVLVLSLATVSLAFALARLALLLRERDRRNDAQLAALRRELTGLEQGRSDLERLSATDPVTGVWNYRYLQQALAKELAWAVQDGRPFALLLCDIDGFGDYTAVHGHQRALGTLRDLAQRLSVEIRSGDTFARYGGDEFVALLPDARGEGAASVAERLCYAVRRGLTANGQSWGDPGGSVEPRLTLSIGIACFPDSGEHAASLVAAADKALAEAKSGGGDGWRLAEIDVVLSD